MQQFVNFFSRKFYLFLLILSLYCLMRVMYVCMMMLISTALWSKHSQGFVANNYPRAVATDDEFLTEILAQIN